MTNPDDRNELLQHQLDILDWIKSDQPPKSDPLAKKRRSKHQPRTGGCPEGFKWGPSFFFKPYGWQKEAQAAWNKNDRRGTAKVITGAGKTALALMCIEELMREDKDTRVSIVVPSIALLHQWYKEVIDFFGLPEECVGRRGGGYKGDFGNGCPIMIYVINSARAKDKNGQIRLGQPLSHDTLRKKHFLIVDECHGAGAPKNKKIFDVPRRYSIGLSATPERNDGEESCPCDHCSLISDYAKIIYNLTFQDAVEKEIIPPFECNLCTIKFTDKERSDYDSSRAKLKKLDRQLGLVGSPHKHPKVVKKLEDSDPDTKKLASRWLHHDSRARDTLYGASNRSVAFQKVLSEVRQLAKEGVTDQAKVSDEAPDALSQKCQQIPREPRVLVFHRRIKEVSSLFVMLQEKGEPVVMDHSKLSSDLRKRSMELYRNGKASILLSAEALGEGVDIPDTDVGISVASSTSPRRMRQAMGRVMRKACGKKISRFYAFFVEESADEVIFQRMSFESELGEERVRYRGLLPSEEWEDIDGPPRAYEKSDWEFDMDSLVVGQEYPGCYEGIELSQQRSNGMMFKWEKRKRKRKHVDLPVDVLGVIKEIRGTRGGKFRVTTCRQRHFVLVPFYTTSAEKRTIFYAGRLPKALYQSIFHPDQAQGDHTEPEKKAKTDCTELCWLKVSPKYQGSLCLQKGTKKMFDGRSPAATTILDAIKTFNAIDIDSVAICPDGTVLADIDKDKVLVKLSPNDGWPFGKKSFSELKELIDE